MIRLILSLALTVLTVCAHAQLDQFNFVSTGNLAVSHDQISGQTFTAGLSGQLTGIEFAPLLDTGLTSDELMISVFDGSEQLLGSAKISSQDFPPGSGVIPAALSLNETGPGFFDLSGLGISVIVGDVFSFILTPVFQPACCSSGNICGSGIVGSFCISSSECQQAFRAGASPNVYLAGTALANGVALTGTDLAFKTFVATETSPLDSDKASSRQVVVDQFNLRGGSNTGPVNLISTGNSVVDNDQIVGQTFVAEFTGVLSGIEIAPLLGTGSTTDEMIMSVYDGTDQLLGTKSITAAGFPPGAGTVPDQLSLDQTGPGFFDFSSSNIVFQTGDDYSFQLSTDFAPGCCDLNFQCASGQVGIPCFSDQECSGSFRAGSSSNVYPNGIQIINGSEFPTRDNAFKIIVTDLPDPAFQDGFEDR
jgi:hypothetical protein